MYRYTESGAILRESDGAQIPCDDLNRDYRAILTSGVEVAPYVAPQKPPKALTLEQLADVVDYLLEGPAPAGEDILFNPTDDISEKQALEAALAQKAEELAIANARIAELEARMEVPAPVADAVIDWPDLNDKLSDWDEVGHGAIASNIPAGIAELMEPGETLTHDVRRKLTERLNVELAELKNLRGLAGEDLKREAEIEKLLGLFARLGEI